MPTQLAHIPTNIVTGFLGAGKTTVIRRLLENKPDGERWAVLVNEFGEIGIDGSLLSQGSSEDIFIREVPGGCMCCAAGLPMQMAMNLLLARAKPHRLLIEPSGLGHPLEVMQVLSSEYYDELLDLQSTITLVDARKITDSRYTSHATFNQQLEIADVIAASKSDLYGEDDLRNLKNYLKEKGFIHNQLITTNDDMMSAEILTGQACAYTGASPLPLPQPDDAIGMDQVFDFPPEGYIRMSKQADGYACTGWVFEPDRVFSRTGLIDVLASINAERIKGVFRTSEGDFAYNKAEGTVLDEMPAIELEDSRIEIISSTAFNADDIEERLTRALDTSY